MMTKQIPRAFLLSFVTLIACSAAVGWFIPYFYNWTDSDQSRPSPLLWIVPGVAGAGAGVFCCVLPWLPIASPETETDTLSVRRFGLRAILVFTTVVAFAIPLFAKFPMVAGIVVCAIAFLHFIWQAQKHSQSRLPAITLLAGMVLPFVWILGYEERDRILMAVLVMSACLPNLLPAAALGAAFGVDFQNSYWIALLLTSVELTLGIWLIRLGPKRTIAFILLVIMISTLSSLGFYQLCRA
ncbi:MAG: hypothetical protein U0930_10655 [Pirellulales bacterium]